MHLQIFYTKNPTFMSLLLLTPSQMDDMCPYMGKFVQILLSLEINLPFPEYVSFIYEGVILTP